MGSHDPRVKYYTGRAGLSQPSFSVSIGPEPRVLASSLSPRETSRSSEDVIAWVRKNHEKLSRFWFNGHDLTLDELNAFGETLEKL